MVKSTNGTISWRVTMLEKNMCDMDKKLDEVLQNHLPHIQEQVSSLKTRIDVLTVVNIGAIVLAMLINKFL
jgi:hypothetical protein